jgi:DNA gyrase/topoisomerase IV subunit B
MNLKYSNKEIIALNSFEAIRLRPGMWIGPISMIEEKIPIIKDGKLQSVDKPWSPGFMHLIVEILENALDEAKRMKGKMKNIHVTVDLDTNKVIVSDDGNGFYKANSRHSKTKKNVVRTAMEDLHAGSNFMDSSTNILGTFGVGSAVVNILSQEFSVTTVNGTHYVHYDWKDYKVVKEDRRRKETSDQRGTSVSFIPSSEIFPGYKWDEELIRTYLSFKNYLIGQDHQLKKLKIDGQFVRNGALEDIGIVNNFLPEKHIAIKNSLGTVLLWSSYDRSCSVSFVNGSQCTGIHQKIINDWGNDFFGYNLAHHFYETVVALDVPSTLMRFGDQNKSKYDVTRFEIE